MDYTTTTTPPPATATAAALPVLLYLAELGFTPSTSNRVHLHWSTGARVVIDGQRLTVHAACGGWSVCLTRAPFAVFVTTVTAAIIRPSAA